MATQQINIRVSATGTVTVVRNLNSIAGAATNAVSPINRLERALRAAYIALGIRQVLEWADAWTAATNKVAVFSETQAEANKVVTELYEVSQRVRQPLSELVTLYHRITIASKDLNTTIAQNIQFTENIGKALAVQGTSSTQARGALIQLSQAMGEGIVRAQEFNSMVENMPLVLQLVAREMHGATGSISSLRAAMLAGKLGSKEFYEAFMRAQPLLDAMFDKTNKTFGQAFTTFSNGMTKFIGELNQAYGLSNKFYDIMLLVSKNLGTIGGILLIIGAGVIAAFAPAIIGAFTAAVAGALGGMLALTALLLTNPFVAIAVATAAVIAFGDSWDAGLDGVTTVKDLIQALGGVISDVFTSAKALVGGAWDEILLGAQLLYEAIGGITNEATSGWSESYRSFFDDTGTGFAGLLRSIAKIMDAIAGLIIGVAIAIGRIFGGLPDVMVQIFNRVYNTIAGWMERATNVVIDGINYIRKEVGLGLLDAVKFDRLAVDEKVFEEYGSNIGKSITDGFDIQGGYMQKKVEDLFGNAQQNAYKRLANQSATPDLNKAPAGGNSVPNAVDKKAEAEAKKLERELRSLLNTISPVEGAMLEMAKAEVILDKAMKASLINAAQKINYMAALERHYKDILHPYDAVIRVMDEEIAAFKLGVDARERDIQFRRIQEDLLKQNVILTKAETEALKDKIRATQDAGKQSAIEDSLLEGSIEKRKRFAQTLEAIARLQSDPASGFTKSDGTEALQNMAPDLFSGTQEAIDLQLEQFKYMYGQIDAMRNLDLISEQTASQMKAKVAVKESELRLSNYSQMFGGLASLASSSNRKIAAIGKAAAVTQATIDGVLAVQKALASAPYPINIAMAAAVGVQAASNVAKILSSNANFATGGDFTIGGTGGVDSQIVAFRGSPGEKVSVSTPQQVRKGTATKEQGSGSSSAPVVNLKSVNVLDSSLIGDYLSTDEGEILVMNIIQRNKSSL